MAVMVRSRATAWLDRGRKRELYQEAGVAHYWLVDPREPSITVLALVDGAYVVRAEVRGAQSVSLTEPFPVDLAPADLARG